mgnify:CR=1 FL=1
MKKWIFILLFICLMGLFVDYLILSSDLPVFVKYLLLK